MTRLLLPAGACLALLGPSGARDDVPPPRNVLILVADDVGVDQIGCYGEGALPATTPHIDALAADGVLFRNAWAAPICSATRSQIMTGRHGFRTGIGSVVNGQFALDLDELTIPEVLDLHPNPPFEHAAFGKWHLGNDDVGGTFAPNLCGWGHFAGSRGNFKKPEGYYLWTRVENGVERVTDTYATSRIVDDFLAWRSGVRGRWFAYVAFHSGHFPLHAPPPDLHGVGLPDVEPRFAPVPFYRAMVEAMDAEIGRLLAGLGDELEETHVIFLGDNGSEPMVSLRPFPPVHAKRTPYEGGLRVPFIVSGPEVRKPGREVGSLVSAVDVFDTALTLAGVDLAALPDPPRRDSVDLLPYLRDPKREDDPLREYAYQELFFPSGFGAHSIDFRTARDERYKLIRDRVRAVDRLYDLVLDPFERRDLLGGELTREERERYGALSDHIDLHVGE